MRNFLSPAAKKRLLASTKFEVFHSLQEKFGTDYEEFLEASKTDKAMYTCLDQLFGTIHQN